MDEKFKRTQPILVVVFAGETSRSVSLFWFCRVNGTGGLRIDTSCTCTSESSSRVRCSTRQYANGRGAMFPERTRARAANQRASHTQPRFAHTRLSLVCVADWLIIESCNGYVFIIVLKKKKTWLLVWECENHAHYVTCRFANAALRAAGSVTNRVTIFARFVIFVNHSTFNFHCKVFEFNFAWLSHEEVYVMRG